VRRIHDTYILDVAKRAIIVDDLLTLLRRHCGRHRLILEVCVFQVMAVGTVLMTVTVVRIGVNQLSNCLAFFVGKEERISSRSVTTLTSFGDGRRAVWESRNGVDAMTVCAMRRGSLWSESAAVAIESSDATSAVNLVWLDDNSIGTAGSSQTLCFYQ